jgi:ApbE superfamily uncharacterized protein (UPF0280 family)
MSAAVAARPVAGSLARSRERAGVRVGPTLRAPAFFDPSWERASADGAQCRRLDRERWHFQHGPIDCIVAAEGDPDAVERAVEAAWQRFEGVLSELVAELPLLRADLSAAGAADLAPHGPIARRMVAACRPHAEDGRFITAMAAVAGSVAEELIAVFDRPGVARASINNGGDIALFLAPGAHCHIGLVADVDRAAVQGIVPHPGHLARAGEGAVLLPDARFQIDAASAVRGIATSGWRGRSFSLGIADSVTVLAASAGVADAAATLIGNAVQIGDRSDDAGIRRLPADRVRDDSDLGERLVTVDVRPLSDALVELALAAGIAAAQAQIRAGRILGAAITLQGRLRRCAGAGAFDTLSSAP